MAGRLREDRRVGRAAAAPGAAAAAVEDRQLEPALPCDRGERLLGAIDRPLGREVAAVLAGVGVADHQLEPSAARGDALGVALVVEQRLDGRGRALEIGDRLEERHDGERLVAQLEHREHVLRALGRRDDHRVKRMGAVAGARFGDRGEDLAGPLARRAQLAGVEADVELGQMEAEELDPPLDSGEPSGGDAVAAVGLEAAAEHREVGEQLGGGRVGVVPEAPAHERQLAAVGLALVGAPELGERLRMLAFVARDRLLELGRVLDERPARGERDLELAHVGLVAGERGLARSLEGEQDRLTVHRRVAVEVAADPASEMERQRCVGQEAAVVGEHALTCVEEALLEEPQPVADLVHHLRAHGADLVGLPEDRDLLRELRLELVALVRAQRGLVEPREQRRDAGLGAQQRAPARLGRMRGQDELERELREAPRALLGGHRGELLEGLPERLARRVLLAVVLAPPAQPVVLLGGVRELEVDAEGPQHPRLALGGERTHGLAHERRVAELTRAPGRGPDRLLGGEERLALLLDEHRPEQRPEQAHVAPQQAVGLFVAAGVSHRAPIFAAGPAHPRREATVSIRGEPNLRICCRRRRRARSCWARRSRLPMTDSSSPHLSAPSLAGMEAHARRERSRRAVSIALWAFVIGNGVGVIWLWGSAARTGSPTTGTA